MSTAVPPMPAEPWCSRTRACGRAYLLPGVPAESRNCPALAAIPIATVLTSLGISRITSWMASIAETEPPGELIHRLMSARGSSAESSSSWCISRLPLPSPQLLAQHDDALVHQPPDQLVLDAFGCGFVLMPTTVARVVAVTTGCSAAGGSACSRAIPRCSERSRGSGGGAPAVARMGPDEGVLVGTDAWPSQSCGCHWSRMRRGWPTAAPRRCSSAASTTPSPCWRRRLATPRRARTTPGLRPRCTSARAGRRGPSARVPSCERGGVDRFHQWRDDAVGPCHHSPRPSTSPGSWR